MRTQFIVECLLIWGWSGWSGGASGASEKCTKTGPCQCERADGSVLDLKDTLKDQPNHFFAVREQRLVLSNETDLKFEINTYLFHPCVDAHYIPPKEIDVLNNCNECAFCYRRTTVTRLPGGKAEYYNATVNDTGYDIMATNNIVDFKPTDKGSIAMTYNHNSVNILVYLVCISNSEHHLVLNQYDSQSPVFTFYSPNACFSAPVEEHSFGTTLLIIFFVGALTYLIAGCCVKHFLMGAQGVEAIPNYTFWRELPDLVKDGITFVQNGFKPPARTATPPGQSPNPNSYDSI